MKTPSLFPLAPIQEIMLLDSLSDPAAGHHVEQLEIVFSRPMAAAAVGEAWRKTVESCDVLRIGFTIFNGAAVGLHAVAEIPEMVVHAGAMDGRESWFEMDQCEALLIPGRVPWRTAFWPGDRRFVWTFHHALLDGRSITKVIRVLLDLLEGREPESLALARWEMPTPETLKLAEEYFRKFPELCESPDGGGVIDCRASGFEITGLARHDRGGGFQPTCLIKTRGMQLETAATDADGPATRAMGSGFLAALEKGAAVLEVTAATILIWSWGQALAEISGKDGVIVEQLRAGPPQPGCAGFTMNVLPLLIRKGPVSDLKGFREQLLELRRFENVSPADFPFGIYPDSSEAPTVMIEHATMLQALGSPGLLESIHLRERPAGVPSAMGYLQPDLQLVVEGPGRQRLLDHWCEVLERADLGILGCPGDF